MRDSASITAHKAFELKVIEIIAKDTNDLLAQLHDREVNGRKLNTRGATVVEIGMSVPEQVFHKLLRPEVMLLSRRPAQAAMLEKVIRMRLYCTRLQKPVWKKTRLAEV